MKKISLWYILYTLCLILFTMIYEWFSFGVTSLWMRFAFLVPLVGGSISLVIQYFFHSRSYILSLWHMSLTAFTAFFVLRGIFEIYGSSEPTVILFLIIGVIMASISLVLGMLSNIKGAHI